MYLLPDLESWCERRCWLSSAGACEFARLAVAAGGDHHAWRQLLLWEPGLALWAAAGLRWQLDDTPHLDELAQWLTDRAVATLELAWLPSSLWAKSTATIQGGSSEVLRQRRTLQPFRGRPRARH